MKSNLLALIVLSILLLSCTSKVDEISPVNDNEELIEMVLKDQKMRLENFENLEEIDQEHRTKVMELLADGKIITNKDKLNAALILQHTNLTYCNDNLTSLSNENYLLAYMLSKSAFENGSNEAAYYVAITFDRYSLYTKGFQKYGTQRVIDDKTEKELWAPIDTSTTDEERAKYNVPALKDLLRMYNIQKPKK
ncbi:hypothetical protein [Aequorivita antarctica]|uniref:Lipoprotein n=1 Tax=Aequorivita antarctica TaxID=153266 RepID=A0A5C6Z1K0_9FLAO|nr:hypothetical protein [Aequorivita antarctica]TXD73258.1 hypothetical protein ESU54_08965 [Aequorivita antarctica]SRX76011.1 hypothetical protein AEQU3_03009 [Aequorivita antarctica]